MYHTSAIRSKGIKDKNVKVLAGTSLLERTIQTVLQSGVFSQVVVSSDSQDYLQIATKHSCLAHLRPPALASDAAKAVDVYVDLLAWYQRQNAMPESFCVSLVTSPFKSSETFIHAVNEFYGKSADSLISVNNAKKPKEWHYPIVNGWIDSKYLNEAFQSHHLNRQSTTQAAIPNGCVNIQRTEEFLDRRNYFGTKCVPFWMDEFAQLDIDDEFDWKVCELIMEHFYDPLGYRKKSNH